MPISGTCVVTGASGGLGKALSIELARRGANVVMVFRDLGKGEVVRHEVVEKSGSDSVSLIVADLASLDEVRRLARDLAEDHSAIAALIHTAAIYTARHRLTPDGLESMFATNHLAPYVLTRLLLPALQRGAPSRVVVVSAPSSSVPDFADLQGEKQFRPLRAFGVSKSGNLLFAFALARRLDPNAITVNAFHPGLMKSGLIAEMSAPLRVLINLFARPPESAARHLADLIAGDIAAPNGAFVARNKITKPPAVTERRDLQDQMWRVSAELAGLPID
jgi:NAD(P)-dependent dehydrogenase (short-subunit alcohol dehydrogenase family)